VEGRARRRPRICGVRPSIPKGHLIVRVTAAFNKILGLLGACVSKVAFESARVVVTVRLRRRRLVCPHCAFSTAARYDTRSADSSWRALDLGVWKVIVQARLRRLRCPEHGVVVEAVPFARYGLDSYPILRISSPGLPRGWTKPQ